MSDDISLIPQERIENLNETLSNVQPKLSSVNAGAGINITEEEGIVKISSASSAPAWGQVTGTLSNQTDLQNALDDKQDELVSGTNIKTINNVSILGSGNIDIQGGGGSQVDIDNISITNNANNQLQTVGVINQNNTSIAVKTWTGTKAQYDALLLTTYYAWTDSGGNSIYTTSSTPSYEDTLYIYYNEVLQRLDDTILLIIENRLIVTLYEGDNHPFNRNPSSDVTITSDGSNASNTQYMITDTGEIYLGSTLLSNYGADTSLSNLTLTGKNIANWSSNVTNCITEIPQDIKLELNEGTLTLKEGSKVYVPNGFETDGTTPKFDEVTISEDLSLTATYNDIMVLGYRTTDNTILAHRLATQTGSGSSTPTSSYWFYYNINENNLYEISNGQITGICSLPLAIFTCNSTQITSLDQVFNGFGYIGSTKFLLPMKGVGTVGKNSDGTYHTFAWEINQVYTDTTSSDINGTFWQGFDLFSDGSMAYFGTYANRNIISPTKPTSTNIIWTNLINGYSYYIDNNGVVGNTPYIPIRFALQSISTGSVTSWSVINNTFTALNYWDKPTISGWSMPSSRYIDLTIGAHGATYTAPANGWFTICGYAGAGAFLWIKNNSNQIMQAGATYSASAKGGVCIPCKKGDSVQVGYYGGALDYVRFIYAEGENV